MNWKFRTTLILFTLGLLISLTHMGKTATDSSVTLTEDNHVVFSGQVDDESVALAQVKLGEISSKLDKSEVIYLVIDSPGGSVSAGNRFVDFGNSLPQKIVPICLFCASMGYHMFQSFSDRLVYESSELMSHRASLGGLGGQVPGELITRLQNIQRILNNMDAKVAKRLGVTTEAYQKSIYDELWLDGASAVRAKHADRIAKIKCSKELVSETKSEVIRTMFGPVDVTYSKCPLITGFLALEFQKKGTQFRSAEEAMTEVRKVKRVLTFKY